MKLLLVTKRHFMTKDIVTESYGRQYELAAGLAKHGWSVKAFCLNYQSYWGTERIDSGGIEWQSYPALSQWWKWRRDINESIAAWKPNMVLGCSDPLHIVVARGASRKSARRFMVDLHDNLDAKGLMRFPGLQRGVGNAIRSADLVSCVSEPLADHVSGRYSPGGRVIVLESSIPEHFQGATHTHKRAVRERYGIRGEDQAIGIAGSLYRRRGIETVLAGFEILRRENSRLRLVLAGPTDKDRDEFDQAGVHYAGNLEWRTIPEFLSALDVGIVPNIRPVFADYCYPQKAVELCALSIPMVAAKLGVMKTMAKNAEEILYQPDDPADFARAVRYQLEHRIILDVAVKSWSEQAESLNYSLMDILAE